VIALAVHIAADQGGRTNKMAEKMFSKKKGVYTKLLSLGTSLVLLELPVLVSMFPKLKIQESLPSL